MIVELEFIYLKLYPPAKNLFL